MSYALKLFEYMQCGMMVIMPDFGDWLSFNESFAVGFNVNVTDSDGVSMLIDGLDLKHLEAFFDHNSGMASSEFLWSTQERKLVSLYGEL